MLDEIRQFFEELREQPRPRWPEGVPTIDLATGEDLRAVSESRWRFMMDCLDNLETTVIGIYNRGVDDPAAIDFIDELVAIIRRKGEPHQQRVEEIWQLARKRGPSISRS
jgi:hypothetical protein